MRSVRIKPRPEKAPVEEPTKTAWKIVLGWLRQESFYREITTRSLSIAVVAFAAYVYALGSGQISSPPRTALLSGALFVLSALGMVLFPGWRGDSVLTVLRTHRASRWIYRNVFRAFATLWGTLIVGAVSIGGVLLAIKLSPDALRVGATRQWWDWIPFVGLWIMLVLLMLQFAWRVATDLWTIFRLTRKLWCEYRRTRG